MAVAIENPIINSPYAKPAWHRELDERRQPTGELLPGSPPDPDHLSITGHPV
jgi:type III restriction enzyme